MGKSTPEKLSVTADGAKQFVNSFHYYFSIEFTKYVSEGQCGQEPAEVD